MGDGVTVKTNLEQTSLVVLLPPVQIYPFSTVQVSDHPSFDVTLLSSHSSPVSLLLLPQLVIHCGTPFVVSLVLSTGHVTVTLKGEFEIYEGEDKADDGTTINDCPV